MSGYAEASLALLIDHPNVIYTELYGGATPPDTAE